MKRLAIFLFCTSTFAAPIDCKDEVCTVDKTALAAMLEARDRAIMERDAAVDAFNVIRARYSPFIAFGCQVKS